MLRTRDLFYCTGNLPLLQRSSTHAYRLFGCAFILLASALFVLLGTQPASAQSAVISGKVTDASGNPLENISVDLYMETIDPLIGSSWFVVSPNNSQADGTYTFPGLDAGRYRVHFVDWSMDPLYFSEYYSNTTDFDQATDIVLTGNEIVDNIDAQLESWGTISGRVTDVNGAAIFGVNVVVYEFQGCCGWTQRSTSPVDSAGNYLVGGLPSGTYRLGFRDGQSPARYQPEYYDNAVTLETATNLVISSGEAITAVNAQLGALGTISGRVTDEAGAPLSFIQVFAHPTSEVGCCDTPTAQTDNNGQYTLLGLPAASYQVQFSDSFGSVYETAYYSNALTANAATLVEVALGQDVTGIDAQLAKLGSISGMVTDEAGNPLLNIGVTVFKENTDACCAGSWESVNSGSTDATGAYTLGGLSAGNYRLFYSQNSAPQLYQYEYYDNAPTLESATDVPVDPGQQVTGIDVQLAKPASISGHITDADGNPAIDWCAYLHYYNVTSEQWEVTESDCQFGSEDDQYRISNVPVGTYRIEFARVNGLDDPTYRREFYNNAFAVEMADDIVVASGQIIENIDAMLDRRTHIGGRVTDNAGTALKNISVGIYKRGLDAADGGQTWELVTSDTTDSNGDYTIYDLPPGSYRVRFSDGNTLYKTEYYDNAYYVQNGQDVELSEGSAADNINAQLEGITLNVPPLAVQDAMTVTRGSMATRLINGASVLTNDSDAEGNSLTAVLVDKPQHGALTLNVDGTFTYTHDGSDGASDSFTYKASDGQAQSSAATVTITVGDSQPQQHFSFLPLSYR